MDVTELDNFIFGDDTDLRNGTIADIVPPSRQAAVEPQYYWPIYAGNERGQTTPHVAVYIRLAYAMLGSSVTARPYGTGVDRIPAGATGFSSTLTTDTVVRGETLEWQNYVAAVAAVPGLRIKAIALGAARASIAHNWRIVDGDISRTERIRVPDVSVGDDGFGVIAPARDIGYLGILALRMDVLTEDEQALAYACYVMGAAVPALTGLCLHTDAHHYLSSNLKPTQAVENQVLSGSPGSVRDAWSSNIGVLRDMVWHKSAHPIDSGLMMAFAVNADVPGKLSKFGVASAGVRLPYVEPLMKTAGTALAIVDAIQPSLQSYGYTLRTPYLRSALDAVRNLAHDGVVTATHGGLVSTGSRMSVVAAVLGPVLSAAEPYVAWCAGYYKAVIDEAGMMASRDTLISAYSIKRVIASNAISYAAGGTAHANGAKFCSTMLKTGRLPPVNLAFEGLASSISSSDARAVAAAPSSFAL
jgi:hypothetical protein